MSYFSNLTATKTNFFLDGNVISGYVYANIDAVVDLVSVTGKTLNLFCCSGAPTIRSLCHHEL
jgi:hypothetical protein